MGAVARVSGDRVAERLEARVASLEEEVETLREEVRLLESAFLGTGWRPPRQLDLSTLESRFLQVLYARPGVATRDQVMLALYGLRHDDPPEPKICDVYICKLRRKLERFGLGVSTQLGQGWYLPPETRAWLAARGTTERSPLLWPVLLLWLAAAAGRRA